MVRNEGLGVAGFVPHFCLVSGGYCKEKRLPKGFSYRSRSEGSCLMMKNTLNKNKQKNLTINLNRKIHFLL